MLFLVKEMEEVLILVEEQTWNISSKNDGYSCGQDTRAMSTSNLISLFRMKTGQDAW